MKNTKRYASKAEQEAAAIKAVKWVEVKRPKKWRFQEPGDELVGRFVGVETCEHPEYGVYRRVLVKTPEGPMFATGTVLIDLVSAAGLRADEFLKITYLETVETSAGYNCNLFALKVEDR